MQTGEAGCIGQEAWCDIGGAHFFVSQDNFFILTSSGITPIGDGFVKNWFVENSNSTYLYRTKCFFDRVNSSVYVCYPSDGSETCNEVLVYHTQVKKWGRSTLNVQAIINYISAGIVIDSLGDLAPTMEELPLIPYDSPYWAPSAAIVSFYNASNQLQLLNGETITSDMTTGAVGDDNTVSMMQQVRLRYEQTPASANCYTFHAMNSGESFDAGVSGEMNDGKFDLLRSARWHQAKTAFVGDVKVTGMQAKFKPAGKR